MCQSLALGASAVPRSPGQPGRASRNQTSYTSMGLAPSPFACLPGRTVKLALRENVVDSLPNGRPIKAL
jgi:hypothetical protein